MNRPASLGLLAALALAVPGAASAAPQRAVAAEVALAPGAPVPAGAADVSGYAQREQRDQQVARYEGGSVVMVGFSGGALVALLLVLLLI